MLTQHSRQVALTEPLSRFLDGQVAQGRHATASEMARAALRLLIEREDAWAGAADAGRQEGANHG